MTSAAPLQLHVTPRMRAAFLRCKQQIDVDRRTGEYRQLQAIMQSPQTAGDAQPALITLEQLQALSRLYRETLVTAPLPPKTAAPIATATESTDAETAPTNDDDAADDDNPGNGWVHELMRGSRPYTAPVRTRPPRDPQFLKYLEEQRVKQERREYHALVKDLPGNKQLDPNEKVDNFATASRDVGHGVNILTLMATGFIVFYLAGSGLFPHNPIMPPICGLIGLIGALMVEVSLWLVREQKASIEAEQHKKLSRVSHREEQQWQQRQVKTGRTKQELERRLHKLKEAQQASGKDAPATIDQLD